MAETTIEWADYTFNPWRGCTKVSPGCANCYADKMSKRNPGTLGVWGPNGTRVVAAESYWKLPGKWNDQAAADGVRRKVFCASLADVFEDWPGLIHATNGQPAWRYRVGREWRFIGSQSRPSSVDCEPATMDDVRRRLFALIDATPNLDWLLVTKRPENIRLLTPPRNRPECGRCHGDGCDPEDDTGEFGMQPSPCRECWHRPNVWLLTSVENQEQANIRIPELLRCRDLSPVLGLSCEPLLGPVRLDSGPMGGPPRWLSVEVDHLSDAMLDWVIAGGESGPNARPMHPDWARSLRDQCQAAGVPFHFKQWGEFSPVGNTLESGQLVDFVGMTRVGKKRAGRLLDGVEWSQYPEVTNGGK